MFLIEKEYFLIAKKFLRLIVICFWVLFMVSKEVLINEKLKRNTNELKSILALSNPGVVQLLHSCGPLFKIIRVCGPQPAKNTYFCPKLRVFSKKKKKRSSIGIDLQNSYFLPKIIAFSEKKVAAACNRQDFCKIVPRARSWTTLY